MSQRRILDAFSCCGLYADGLEAAGWSVTCLDNDRNALKHNPHETVEGDAIEALNDLSFLWQFDAVHASPPCQFHSATRQLAKAQGRGTGRAIDLLPPTLAALRRSGLPWVVENVERSPLAKMRGTVTLCGSTFGLPIKRHRLFTSEWFQLDGGACDHAEAWERDPITGKPRPWGVYYAKGDNIPSGGRTVATLEQGHEVMGVSGRQVPWKYLCEGLPPAYGFDIGQQMLAQIATARPLTLF